MFVEELPPRLEFVPPPKVLPVCTPPPTVSRTVLPVVVPAEVVVLPPSVGGTWVAGGASVAAGGA